MAILPRSWAVIIANVLTPLAVLVFSSGFFPYKPLIPGLARFEDGGNHTATPKAFDKVIFMVIDALRSDFVYSNNSGFLFTQSLIRSGAALPFTAYASSPTVTMPRLKAITTGSKPSFLDVILNIAESDTSSTLAYQDTWLAQLKANGGQLVMYGDDTWLKLFPGMFERADGTTSFFVSDFIEVDNNVTRHVSTELSRDDWSAFIMHYLGLDHIGHKAGPQSPYMTTKQQEMDSIVANIYTSMEQQQHLQSTLFVLCGDHGMNDAGNHGGSSVGETSPALLFISPKFQALDILRQSPTDSHSDFQYYRTVDQTDITPTLAGLLGLPIPLNSLGVFIPELLDLWETRSQRIDVLLSNSRQILRKMTEMFPNRSFDINSMNIACDSGPLVGVDLALCAWFRVNILLQNSGGADKNDLYSELESALFVFLKHAQEVIRSAASDYDLRNLLLGLAITSFVVLLPLPTIYTLLCKSWCAGAFFALCLLGYGGMMFASSYVEEEQQFWNWMFTAWVFCLHVRSSILPRCSMPSQERNTRFYRLYDLSYSNFGALALLLSHRVLRRWNQTGQKFATEPDIARTFFPSHRLILWFLVILTYANTCRHLLAHRLSKLWQLCCVTMALSALLLKLSYVASDSPELLPEALLVLWKRVFDGGSTVLFTRLVVIGIMFLIPLSMCIRNTPQLLVPSTVFHDALTLFLVTQSRATNIPIFLILRAHANILATMNLSALELAITSLIAQYMTFFAFGGSNSIATVDLSNAYNGIGTYNVVLVGILTFISNWAGPIWWVSAAQALRLNQARHERESHMAVLTFHMAATLMSVMAACTILRSHLFIWTVFSPKYLYAMAWAILNHLAVNLLGEVLHLISSKLANHSAVELL
ncbi:GPI ethanolamine phosphate transferase 2 [Aspergillus eucalypticola CBS 122712]|uniref:GPI ethanolamine phosphate transferase 2 n=1 Tax=Aspergillus eucalypticola (strain CBS 122712 / IBT 29274) TaxID=1448314 RepID=A0A317UKD5_ASPEC|nr:GPI ethanolamine phosphate transferase 2 [Aspergillus eucalypticola CBS 122712]PWY61855.1 GPI ethanolamine phosphate transferase 2 [Aspergillus eucalypticola CBS 122712]